jgi:hypothetical protein
LYRYDIDAGPVGLSVSMHAYKSDYGVDCYVVL